LRAVPPGLSGPPLGSALRLLHLFAAGNAPVGVVAEEGERAAYGARLAILQRVRGLRAAAVEREVERGRAVGVAAVCEGDADADIPARRVEHLRRAYGDAADGGEIVRGAGDDALVYLYVVV